MFSLFICFLLLCLFNHPPSLPLWILLCLSVLSVSSFSPSSSSPSCHLSPFLPHNFITPSSPFCLSLPSPPSLQSHLSLRCHCAENYTSLKAVTSDKTLFTDIVGSNTQSDRGSSVKQPSYYPTRRTHKLYLCYDSCRYIQFTSWWPPKGTATTEQFVTQK